jgi:tetratricopeptide (TPR) repeat protein
MESVSPVIWVTLAAFLIIAAVALIVFSVRGKAKNLFRRAESLKEHAKYAESLKIYLKAIAKLERGKADEESVKANLLGKSYLACASVYDNTGNKDSAYEFYRKSVNAGIPVSTRIILFSAPYCFDHKIIDDFSINIFIHFLILKPAEGTSRKINNLLSETFYIDEKSPVESINRTLSRCEQIINSKIQSISSKKDEADNLNFEWVNYYAGLAYFLKKDYKKAISKLNLASKSKDARPVSRYWLAMSIMQHLISDRENSVQIESARYYAVIDTLTGFINLDSSNPEIIAKQKTATHKSGIFIVKMVQDQVKQPGFELSGETTRLLNLAASYLESSVRDQNKDTDSAFFYLGRTYTLLQQPGKALQNYREALAEMPENDLLYLYLGQESFRLNDYLTTLEYLNLCLKKNRGNTEARRLIIAVCSIQKQYPEVEHHYLILAESNMADRESKRHYLTSLYHQKKYVDISGFAESDLTQPETKEWPVEILFLVGKAYIYQKLWKTAQKYFKKLPKKVEYQYYSGLVLANLDLYKEAEAMISGLKSQDPMFQNHIDLLSGNIYTKLGDFDKARDCYIKCYNLHPEDMDINEALGYFYLNIGKPEEAGYHFNKAVSGSEPRFNIAVGLACVYESLKKYQESLASYIIAFRQRSEDWIKLKMGILYALTGDFTNAREYLENFFLTNPENDSCLKYLGYTYFKLDEFEKAKKLWEELYKKDSGDKQLQICILEAVYNNGIRLIGLGQYDQAISEWELYTASNPEEHKTRKELARLYFLGGLDKLDTQNLQNLSELKECYFEKALLHDPKNTRYMLHLALIEIALKNFRRAQSLLDELDSTDPGKDKYRYYLSMVLLETGYKEEALSILKELKGYNTGNVYGDNARTILANELIRDLNYSEAITLLEELV